MSEEKPSQPISIFICGPWGLHWRAVLKCPAEGVLRRMVVLDEIYHGQSHTCLGCGEMWQDGFSHRMPRDTKNPRWRERRRKDARAKWKKAKQLNGPEHKEWYENEMKEILG